MSRQISSFSRGYIMNAFHIVAKIAQALLAATLVFGSVLVFQSGYTII
jgi:hypothetical protein